MSELSRREIIVVLVAASLFLLFQVTVVGALPTHFLMVALFLLFYFAHPLSRKLAIALLPFIAFEVCYDWMRLYPNYRVNDVDIEPLYRAELSLFGISSEGTTMIPGQYFMLHHNAVADFLAGCFYLCWVPVPMLFGIWLYFKGEYRRYVHFSLCFLFVNLLGFAFYYVHPAAPPWYVLTHGFEADFSTPGNVAGLIRFDEMLGIPVFQSIYVGNSNIFAAVPSLHAAYMLITTIYAAPYRKMRVVFAVITVGIWWTAVYSCHHYIIDVLLGIITAVVGVLLFEKVLARQKRVGRQLERYAAYIACLLALMVFVLPTKAQTELNMELQSTTSSGTNTPLWLNANRYGLSSLEKSNGYVRAALIHQPDTLKKWTLGYGVDVAVAHHFTSKLVVQQAYADIGWRSWRLTVGSKEQPVELRNQQLSSGAQTLGVNARPVPAVRLSLPDYAPVPGTHGNLAFKGHLAYGCLTDDNWQESFVCGDNKYAHGTLYHSKAGYLRIGNPQRTVNVELGLEMACLFGGVVYITEGGRTIEVKNKTGFTSYLNAFVPGGVDVGENVYKNREGNHLGSYLLRVNIQRPSFTLGLYADHFFEDHSQMFFLDYDGYGSGEEYQEWKHNRWFVYELHDMMLGVDLRLKRFRWMDAFTCEYLYTKHQSGPVNHDRTREISDHVAGEDNYYNHYINSGWQHWGQVMGNPLYRSPLYNTDGSIRVANNRFWAWHVGLGGHPLPGLSYRLLATWQRGWGTYFDPLPDPERNASFMAEAAYDAPASTIFNGWNVKAAVGIDHGHLTGNNTGVQLTLSKRLLLK